MSIRDRIATVSEEPLEVFGGERVDLLLVLDDVLQALLAQLALVNTFLDRAGREEPVRVASTFLTVAPAPRGGLLVRRRIPVEVE